MSLCDHLRFSQSDVKIKLKSIMFIQGRISEGVVRCLDISLADHFISYRL